MFQSLVDLTDESRAPQPHELLGRAQQVVYGEDARQVLRGQRVLVTGAGGSIGSEIVRQVSDLHPEEVILLDHDESAMHAVHLELTGSGLLEGDRIVLADIRDEQRIRRVFRQVRPTVVFHAAAHKHLPLLERFPCEGVKTNVLGTQRLLEAATEARVERFIVISTDKAADPTSVLGATKRLSEVIASRHSRGDMRVASVRFGNVLGSRGSFLQTLVWQMRNGRPVTITHPDVTRFFMTIPEAVGLVIEAGAMAQSGETYVLDMGDPVGITDLVRNYARLAGLPEPQVRFSGLRPGEKMHEALFDVDETRRPTANRRIWAVDADLAAAGAVMEHVDKLTRAALDDQDEEVREMLNGLMTQLAASRLSVAVPA